ncbi:MAG: 16S rRNA (cytosine(1402)-N(4))-methyltransferase RsmH [Proteobacteria bacterium]|nr:16S rRNA (cytosine(1402)-N(4))-methyltransferase RsmH [Pseudomonadota bacterium]
MISAPSHMPVMLDEVMSLLDVHPEGVYVDATFGRGGYSAAILATEKTKVWAIDRDPEAIAAGKALKKQYASRLQLIQGHFSEMDSLLTAEGVGQVDGVVLDMGVSSPQLDDSLRGFSFRKDGPLDMRMDKEGVSAADALQLLEEEELAGLIADYGEERHARRVAKAIVKARKESPITRTQQLAEIVRSAVPVSADGIDPATRTFQALRIYVNNELEELEKALPAAEKLLKSTGRLVVVAFHSLEDRMVKNFLRTRSGNAPGLSRHLPRPANDAEPRLRLLTPKPLRPSEKEIEANPRAASAKLRAAERIFSPHDAESLVDLPAI